jgi:hypothetical protein
LLEASLAGGAVATGVHYATDADIVAELKVDDLRTDFRDAADDFVARHAGVGREAPLVSSEMKVRVTNAAEQNFDLNVLCTHVPAVEGMRRQRRGGASGGETCAYEHESLFRRWERSGRFFLNRRRSLR